MLNVETSKLGFSFESSLGTELTAADLTVDRQSAWSWNCRLDLAFDL